MTADADDFARRLAALLAAGDSAPPPRNEGERWLAVAALAARCWSAAQREPARAVPVAEHVELRRRLRDAEREVRRLRGER